MAREGKSFHQTATAYKLSIRAVPWVPTQPQHRCRGLGFMPHRLMRHPRKSWNWWHRHPRTPPNTVLCPPMCDSSDHIQAAEGGLLAFAKRDAWGSKQARTPGQMPWSSLQPGEATAAFLGAYGWRWAACLAQQLSPSKSPVDGRCRTRWQSVQPPAQEPSRWWTKAARRTAFNQRSLPPGQGHWPRLLLRLAGTHRHIQTLTNHISNQAA